MGDPVAFLQTLIRAQPEDVRRRIRTELDRIVEPCRQPDGTLELPVAVKIGAGRLE